MLPTPARDMMQWIPQDRGRGIWRTLPRRRRFHCQAGTALRPATMVRRSGVKASTFGQCHPRSISGAGRESNSTSTRPSYLFSLRERIVRGLPHWCIGACARAGAREKQKTRSMKLGQWRPRTIGSFGKRTNSSAARFRVNSHGL